MGQTQSASKKNNKIYSDKEVNDHVQNTLFNKNANANDTSPIDTLNWSVAERQFGGGEYTVDSPDVCGRKQRYKEINIDDILQVAEAQRRQKGGNREEVVQKEQSNSELSEFQRIKNYLNENNEMEGGARSASELPAISHSIEETIREYNFPVSSVVSQNGGAAESEFEPISASIKSVQEGGLFNEIIDHISVSDFSEITSSVLSDNPEHQVMLGGFLDEFDSAELDPLRTSVMDDSEEQFGGQLKSLIKSAVKADSEINILPFSSTDSGEISHQLPHNSNRFR